MNAVQRRAPDIPLFGLTLTLIGFGVVMIYSASAIVALEQFGDAAFFLKRQLLWVLFGIAGMSIALTVRHDILRRWTPVLLALVSLALLLVLVPGIGKVAGGARRWLGFGPFTFQPAEAAKFMLVLYLANYLGNRGPGVRRLASLAPPMLVTGAWFGLILLQPDMGSAMILVLIAGTMLFLGGARLHHLALAGLGAAPPVGILMVLEPYRVRRLMAFLDPWRDPRGSGFHIIQSLLALGSGGLLGVGLGQSRQKFFYLPERHTDFIFAILGEELGMVGTIAVLVLFALLAARGFRIARAAPDRYSALLAGGITVAIVGQAILNIGVASGLLPITGVPLPLISFGGSSLFITCLELGVLLNISQYATRREAGAARAGLRPARQSS